MKVEDGVNANKNIVTVNGKPSQESVSKNIVIKDEGIVKAKIEEPFEKSKKPLQICRSSKFGFSFFFLSCNR